MGNADMPAMPQSGTEGNSGDLNSSEDWGGVGLTKREHFAGLAMQGFIAAGHGGMPNASELADYAVRYADALLLELAK